MKKSKRIYKAKLEGRNERTRELMDFINNIKNGDEFLVGDEVFRATKVRDWKDGK